MPVVKRLRDKLIGTKGTKVVLQKDIPSVITTYVLQVRLEELIRKEVFRKYESKQSIS